MVPETPTKDEAVLLLLESEIDKTHEFSKASRRR